MAVVENTTGRLAIRYPTNANNGIDFATGIADLATDVDAKMLERSFGKSIIATTETRTNVAYGLMPTPDRVQNIVLPTDGLIFVAYQATWQEAVANAGRAAIFIGANQLKAANGASFAAYPVAAGTNGTNVAVDTPLATFPGGLVSGRSPSGNYGGDAITGQIIGVAQNVSTELNGSMLDMLTTGGHWGAGGICQVFAAAGTYDISVQFKAASGSVTVKNRRLWVWSMF